MHVCQEKTRVSRHPVRHVYEVARIHTLLESGYRNPVIPFGHVVRVEVADGSVALLPAFAFVEHHLLALLELRRSLISVDGAAVWILRILNSHFQSSKSSFPWHEYAVRL